MKKILAFAGSNSSASINHQLVGYAASLIDFAQVDVISLKDFPAPIFGVDLESEQGIPASMRDLVEVILRYDGFIISTPEHNGIPTAFFLNTLDWLSRIERKIFREKPAFLMSTSPGAGAGVSALEILENAMPRFGAKISSIYAFPSFNLNFQESIIQNEEERVKLKIQLKKFEEKILEIE